MRALHIPSLVAGALALGDERRLGPGDRLADGGHGVWPKSCGNDRQRPSL